MINQVLLVGRLTQDLEVTESENGKKVSVLILAVPRSFKNADGVYETDFIKCVLWNAVASNTSEYCKKGDVVGIRGRLQVNTYEAPDGTKKQVTEVVADKVSFISSKNIENADEAEE